MEYFTSGEYFINEFYKENVTNYKILKMYKERYFMVFVLITFSLLKFIQCDSENEADEAISIATDVTWYFTSRFQECLGITAPSQQFLTDNLQSFVYYPAKTTVGFAPRFTSNRKFFANLLGTTAFKEMLANDEEELRKELLRKMKYCDEIVMDQGVLREFYDREVDQSKL